MVSGDRPDCDSLSVGDVRLLVLDFFPDLHPFTFSTNPSSPTVAIVPDRPSPVPDVLVRVSVWYVMFRPLWYRSKTRP